MKSNLVPYRGETSDYDELMDVQIRRFTSMDALTIDVDAPARYIIQDPSFSIPIDVLFIPRSDSDRLLVGFHGAEMRTEADLPKFQFVRSVRERQESLLFVSDSTLLQGNSISLGWLAGNSSTPLSDLIAQVIHEAVKVVQAKSTILIGHSAGGFMAMLVGSKIPSSRAISVNGQISLSLHRDWTNTRLRKTAFPEYNSNAEMLSAFPERFDLREALANRADNSTFTYFAHSDDRLTMTEHRHYPALAEFFSLSAQGGRTSRGDALVPARWDTSNTTPHALPGTIKPFLQAVLGEITPSKEITYSADPRWDQRTVGKDGLQKIRPQKIRLISINDLEHSGHNAPINSLDQLAWGPISDRGAFRVQSNLARNLTLDSLIVNKASDTLVVSFHGATNRESTQLPRFERLRTLLGYETSSMFYSDPTLQLNDTMQLAWFSGWEEEDLQWRIALEIVQVAAAIGASNIILSGSSGGGLCCPPGFRFHSPKRGSSV